MGYIEIDTVKVLNSLPNLLSIESEQIGTAPTDLVYRITKTDFNGNVKELTIGFMAMNAIMKLIEKEKL